MAKTSSVLGLNARNYLYIHRYNLSRAKRFADEKILGKKLLVKHHLPTPKLVAVFRNFKDVKRFSWEHLPASFVVKPNQGYGGEGIWIIKKRAKYAGEWFRADGVKITWEEIELHLLDILEGQYSLHDVPDFAFIEERIPIHKKLRKYTWRGTPDIRVIVFNKVPVIAELRLPTRESGGRANLHQGAVGVGVDIASGVTTNAVLYDELIKFVPGKEVKLVGFSLPLWEEILKLAVRAAQISGLGFAGVDIVIDPERGPMVLELNSRPGLAIQLANLAPLKRRLERVEGLKVDSAEKGVRIAQALFSKTLPSRLAKERKVIGFFEEVKVLDYKGKKHKVKAKIDTGADRTSIDRGLARSLGLLRRENILFEKYFKSAMGREKRRLIGLKFYLAKRKVKTSANVSDRSKMRTKIIVGRRDLGGFILKP
jgi:alpha-L-glutamate ligase-like protein